MASRWYDQCPGDPLLLSIKAYTEAFYKDLPWEKALQMLVTEQMELREDPGDDNRCQYIYRLAGSTTALIVLL